MNLLGVWSQQSAVFIHSGDQVGNLHFHPPTSTHTHSNEVPLPLPAQVESEEARGETDFHNHTVVMRLHQCTANRNHTEYWNSHPAKQ